MPAFENSFSLGTDVTDTANYTLWTEKYIKMFFDISLQNLTIVIKFGTYCPE